jgi:hypothetical protein
MGRPARAASLFVAGRTVETGELVVSLRDFIRKSLHLAPIPPGVAIPRQGPTRIIGKSGMEGGKDEGKNGGGGMGGGMGGGGMGGIFGATAHEDGHEDESVQR